MARALPLTVVCLAAFTGGCTRAQAPALRTSGKIMAIGGVAGIVASAFATTLSDHANEALLGFEVISAVGIVTYAYTELTYPRTTYVAESLPEKHHRWAKILTERASGAAREGRCERVRRLEPRVQTYDHEVHDFVFMRDPEIVRCLGASPSTEPTPAEPTPSEPALVTPREADQAP